MNVTTFSLSKDGGKKLSDNFTVREFACKDGSDKILIDLDMIPILQTIRNIGGRLTINSAYRTVSHNLLVGGATNSYHLKGRAFDIVSENLSVSDVCDLANTLGVKGIIKYPTFTHIDSRQSKYHADNKGNRMQFGFYEETALDYLVKTGRIIEKNRWHNRLKDVDVKWLIIKFAKDAMELDKFKNIK